MKFFLFLPAFLKFKPCQKANQRSLSTFNPPPPLIKPTDESANYQGSADVGEPRQKETMDSDVEGEVTREVQVANEEEGTTSPSARGEGQEGGPRRPSPPTPTPMPIPPSPGGGTNKIKIDPNEKNTVTKTTSRPPRGPSTATDVQSPCSIRGIPPSTREGGGSAAAARR